MSRWRGKYVIGLTGNIATGKSVIRKMLEHLGAYGIDADALSHRAIAKDAPGYQQVVDTFGKWVLDKNNEIDRDKLGKIVFNDPAAMGSLEKIIHPLVEQAIGRIVERATQSVIVIEAIKLIESRLSEACDSVWAVYSFPEQQKSRLMNSRHMPEEEAQQRIDIQPAQEEKVEAAQVVIKNIATFEDTWRQVVANWKKYVSVEETQAEIKPTTHVTIPQGELTVKRGGPRDAKRIAELMTEFDPEKKKHSQQDVMADLGEEAFLMLSAGETLVGLIGWQVENLIARTTNLFFNPGIPLEKALPVMISEMEQASNDLQCEASLIFVSPELAMSDKLWRKLGYEQRTAKALGVLVWQEAAEESAQPGTVLLFKQLRTERVLRPI